MINIGLAPGETSGSSPSPSPRVLTATTEVSRLADQPPPRVAPAADGLRVEKI